MGLPLSARAIPSQVISGATIVKQKTHQIVSDCERLYTPCRLLSIHGYLLINLSDGWIGRLHPLVI